MGWRVPAVHARPLARESTVVVVVNRLLPKKTRHLHKNLKNNWHVDRPAEQCTKALRDTCSAAREISLDTVHRSARTRRKENKHATAPTRQGPVPTVAAAENAAAAAAAASGISA